MSENNSEKNIVIHYEDQIWSVNVKEYPVLIDNNDDFIIFKYRNNIELYHISSPIGYRELTHIFSPTPILEYFVCEGCVYILHEQNNEKVVSKLCPPNFQVPGF